MFSFFGTFCICPFIGTCSKNIRTNTNMTAAKGHIDEDNMKDIPVLELFISYENKGVVSNVFIFDPFNHKLYNGNEYGDRFVEDKFISLLIPPLEEEDDEEEEEDKELSDYVVKEITMCLLRVYAGFDMNKPVYGEDEENDDGGEEINLKDQPLGRLIDKLIEKCDYKCVAIMAYTVARYRRNIHQT